MVDADGERQTFGALMLDINALIRRWNKYHPINREVVRHIQELEQQGESIWTSWRPHEVLNVLALCWWAVETLKSKQGGGLTTVMEEARGPAL